MEPVLIGSRGIPSRTLGWQLLSWAADYLRQPDGPDAGGPFRFTREQVVFLLQWYAVDEAGRFAYRSGVYRRMKGHGKDPVGAALCAMELCGPSQFDGFDTAGDPVGRPHPAPWIQVAAVSREQTRNTFTLFPAMFGAQLVEDYGLEINREIVHAAGGGRIEAVTSSPKSLEGGRSHFVLMNETQFWLANNFGHEMEGVIAGNTAKGRGGASRRLAICNAHVPGMDSVAEHDYELWQAIETRTTKATGFLYDSREAPPETDLYDEESLREGLAAARGDSTWLDIDRLVQEIYDPRTPVTESRRKYLNQVVAAEDSWLAPHEWDACRSDVELKPGERVTLGFDGSRNDDSTVLMACRVSDGVLFRLAAWEHPPHDPDWEVPRADVDNTVRAAFRRYRVAAVYADIYYWESYVDGWSADFGRRVKVKASARNAFAFDMRARIKDFGLACEAFHEAVLNQHVHHDGDAVLRRHVLNAKRRVTRYDHIGIGKESRDSKRKIDAAVTAVLAWTARQEVMRKIGAGVSRVVFYT